ILGTREVRRRRPFGLGTREVVEVTADDGLDGLEGVAEPRRPTAMVRESLQASVGEQLSHLHAMVEDLSRQGRVDHLLPDLPSHLVPTYSSLLEADVPEVLARHLTRAVADQLDPYDLADPVAVREALRRAVECYLPIAPPIAAIPGVRRVVALVGPTGVGKTTTVAKLAATFKLVHGLRLGLVTVDTYRIAAV